MMTNDLHQHHTPTLGQRMRDSRCSHVQICLDCYYLFALLNYYLLLDYVTEQNQDVNSEQSPPSG